MREIGNIKVSEWSWFATEYVYVLHRNRAALEEVAAVLRKEGYIVTVKAFVDRVYVLDGQREKTS